jgi:WD40 repeat protein
MTIVLRLALVLGAFTVLASCATPQIQVADRELAVEVKSKTSAILVVRYSPSGTRIAAGGYDGGARVWDLGGARRAVAVRQQVWVSDVAFAPDEKTIAVASAPRTKLGDHLTALRSAATGAETLRFEGDFGGKLSFTPDGNALLGQTGYSGEHWGKALQLRDTRTGRVIWETTARNGVLSRDGRYVAAEQTRTTFALLDASSGRVVWTRPLTHAGPFAFSPDGRQIFVARNEQTGNASDLVTSIVVLDAATGRSSREFGRTVTRGGMFAMEPVYRVIRALAVAPDGRTLITGDQGARYQVWDAAAATLLRQLKVPDELAGTMLNAVPSVSFSPDGRTAIAGSLAAVRLYDVASGQERATFIAFEDGEWLLTTPSGYYHASDKGDEYLNVTVAGKPYTIAQLREAFFRPELVKLALAGRALQEFKKVADVKPPPVVAIVDTPASVSSDTVTVALRVNDTGGGIGDVRLYRNGSAVLLDRSHALRYTVRLEPGKNAIRAIAFNADNSMQSADAVLEIQAAFGPRAPALHAVVVGIKDFVNPRLALKYTIADAEIFAATLEDKARGLFSVIHVRRLLTPAETTSAAIVEALRRAQKEVGPEDLFVFFVASHGTVEDGEYFLITSNVGSTSSARLRADALGQDQLKELIANVPASKKLVVLDTCNAGKLGDTLQAAMLTRGLSDDTAMKMLSRAVGSTVLSAATSAQEAAEGYNGHGLFTWVVVEGLKGAADADRDGFVKTLELADYVDNQVPELAERVFKHKQFPIISPSGHGFPLVKVR